MVYTNVISTVNIGIIVHNMCPDCQVVRDTLRYIVRVYNNQTSATIWTVERQWCIIWY